MASGPSYFQTTNIKICNDYKSCRPSQWEWEAQVTLLWRSLIFKHLYSSVQWLLNQGQRGQNDWNGLVKEGPGTCKTSGRKKSPFWQISLRVLFPWGPSRWWCCRETCGCLELLLPGADQSEHVTGASEGKIWKCQHLPEPTFCGFCILSLPKALFWPDLFVRQGKEQLCEKGCIPNTFQVCAKITRE